MDNEKKDLPVVFESEKKGYISPRLLTYGNIAEVTKAVGMNGEGDGSGAAMLKTS